MQKKNKSERNHRSTAVSGIPPVFEVPLEKESA